eukprot:jgi/Ulvmu1/7319/UM035_0108.1
MNTDEVDVEGILEGLRAVRDHDVVEAALVSIKTQAESLSSVTFVRTLLALTPGLDELWALWQAQPSQMTAPVTIAVLGAFSALLSIQIPHEPGDSPVAVALSSIATLLLSTHMTPFYRLCSSGDLTRASHALRLLATAVSRSPSHVMEFLRNFNFAFNMLPRLAAPPPSKHTAKASGNCPAPSATTTGNNSADTSHNSKEPAMRPPRELFVELAIAVLRSAPAGPGLAIAMRTPQLLPLVMHNLSRDSPQLVTELCSLLLSRVLTPGGAVGPHACAALFDGKALWQLALVSSGAGPAAPDSAGAGRKHQEAAAAATSAVLLRAASAPSFGLWDVAHGDSCRLLRLAAVRSACVSPQASAVHCTASSGSSRATTGQRSSKGEGWEELTDALQRTSERSAGRGDSAAREPVRIPSGCTSCSLLAMPGDLWVPKKALLGLVKRLRFHTVAVHLHFLLYLVRSSPAMATAVLASRDLAPHNTTAACARLRCQVASACLQSASRAAAPLHVALAAAHGHPGGPGLGGAGTIQVSKSQVSAFLDSVMPPNIAKGLMSRALSSGDLAMATCALGIMHEQLQSVAVVAAALRRLSAIAQAHTAQASVHLTASKRQQALPREGAAAPARHMSCEAVEALLSQHIRGHCPQPADLHSLFPKLLAARLGAAQLPDAELPTGVTPAGGGSNEQKQRQADNGSKGGAEAAEEAEQGLVVNVEGLVEDTREQGVGGGVAARQWDRQAAGEAAQLLLQVCLRIVWRSCSQRMALIITTLTLQQSLIYVPSEQWQQLSS